MELDQLVQSAYMGDKPAYIQPFDMETLGQAFQLRETAPVDLPSVNQKVSSRTKRRSIKSTKTKTGKKIRTIRSTNIGIKIGLRTKIKTKTRIGKRIKVDIMILVASIQRNIMRRRGSTREQRIQGMCISTRRVSTRVPKSTRWEMDLVNIFLLVLSVSSYNLLLNANSDGFWHQNPVPNSGMMS